MLSPTSNANQARDMTGMNFDAMNPVTASGGLLVNFFYHKVEITSVDPEISGTFEDRLCISRQPKGDRSTVSVNYITDEEAARDYPAEFAMFSRYDTVPTTGTPLDQLPGATMQLVGLLTMNGLRSVEDLVELSEDQVGQLGLTAIKFQKLAVNWMKAKSDNEDLIGASEAEAKFAAKEANMQREMEAMRKANIDMKAELAAMQRMNGNAGQTASIDTPIAVDADDDGLETDITKMPDAFSEGPDTIDDGLEDLTGDQGNEFDPLT